MNLLDFRKTLVTDIQALAPAKVKIVDHPGRFNLDDLARYAADAPCVRIATIAMPSADDLSQLVPDVTVGAYIITKQLDGKKADEANLVLTQWLLQLLDLKQRDSSSFGGTDASAPRSVSWQNLHTTPEGATGIALSAFTWSQRVAITPLQPGALADFAKLYTDYDEGADGKTEARDQQDLPQ